MSEAWKDIGKEKPVKEGLYLAYYLNGNIKIVEWVHMYKGIFRDVKGNMAESYSTFKDTTYGHACEDLGYVFVTCNSYNKKPTNGIVLWAEIPELPDEIDERHAKIRKYEEQIKSLKEKVKLLKGGDDLSIM